MSDKSSSKLIEIFSGEQFDDNWPDNDCDGTKLIALIAWFQSKLDAVPSEFKETARCQLGVSLTDDDYYSSIKIWYTRPETEQEISKREFEKEEKSRRDQAAWEQIQEQLARDDAVTKRFIELQKAREVE